MSDAWIKSLNARDRHRLKQAALARLALIDAQAAAEDAERRFEAEAGERADQAAELAKCAADSVHWINTWVWTFDPRLIGQKNPDTGEKMSPFVPFRLWPKQVEAVRWFEARMDGQEEGVWEKSRDAGASYVACAVLLHRWLFVEGFKATLASRDADLVDNRDDPDSLFEKIRFMLRRLPAWMLPKGFSWRTHDNKARLINPANGAVLTGEAGDEIGRGGRSSVFVVDEGAFLSNAEAAEAALSGNTDCVLWISSANGMGNLFYRKRMTLAARAPHQVFRLHYRDDPRKTPEWVAKKRATFTDETKWASEYEIDYAASVEGICIPGAWVVAAQELLQLEPRIKASKRGIAGVDIGGGKARSVAICRHGPVVTSVRSRTGADTTETAYWALDVTKAASCSTLNFDAPGIGAGVASTLSHADPDKYAGITSVPVNTGLPPTDRIWPDERTSAEMFGNLKAELWGLGRTRFQLTFWHVQAIKGEPGFELQPIDDLIALPPAGSDPDADALAAQLSVVKRFRNERGKDVIESKAQLAKRSIPSPDYADAFMLSLLEGDDDGLEGLQLDGDSFSRSNPWDLGEWAGGGGGFGGFSPDF